MSNTEPTHCDECKASLERGCHYVYQTDGTLVSGKVSLKHECNAKCLSSHGFKCECSCGGKNHGASYDLA